VTGPLLFFLARSAIAQFAIQDSSMIHDFAKVFDYSHGTYPHTMWKRDFAAHSGYYGQYQEKYCF
jgi:hypothetical protein